MSLESYDYANFIANNSVTIESGFHVESGAKLKIKVGSQPLAKRSVAHGQIVPPRGDLQQSLDKVSNFTAQYSPASKSVRISFEAPIGADVSLVLFDLKGARRAKIGDFRATGRSFSKTFSLHDLPNGTYFIKAQVGSERFQRPIVKW